MFPKDSPVKQICFALVAALACSMIPSALANNVALPACSDNRTITKTTTQYVTKTTTVYSLQTSTSVETISSGPTETETSDSTSISLVPPPTATPSTSLVPSTTEAPSTSVVPPRSEAASTTREVITITTVPPVVESTVYVNCTTVPPTGTATITSPIPSPTACVYPSPNRECAALAAPKNLDIYAAFLDGCSIIPARNTSAKWAGVARAHFNRTNRVFRIDIEYSPSLVDVTGVTIARAHTTTLAPKLLRLKLSTPRWKPAQQIFSTSVTLSTAPVRLTASAAEALYNGFLYVTVNTARRPVGAIRGQLYCAGPKCAPGTTGVVTTLDYPKFTPTSCNPKNTYARILSRQKCFACI